MDKLFSRSHFAFSDSRVFYAPLEDWIVLLFYCTYPTCFDNFENKLLTLKKQIIDHRTVTNFEHYILFIYFCSTVALTERMSKWLAALSRNTFTLQTEVFFFKNMMHDLY